jgi:OST-HTH/LOTUS domain
MRVFGMGEKKTPLPFISACDKFIYIEILDSPAQEEKPTVAPANDGKKVAAPTAKAMPMSMVTPELIRLFKDSINDLAGEDGWVSLGHLGELIIKRQPDFDPRNYGFKKLSTLIKNMPAFELQERSAGKGSDSSSLYVRIKPLSSTPSRGRK